MANSEIVDIVIQTVSQSFIYMLPVVGVLAGANFVIGWIMSILFGRHTGIRS